MLGRLTKKTGSIIIYTGMVTPYITYTMVCSRITGFASLLIMTTFILLNTQRQEMSQLSTRASGWFTEGLVSPTLVR